ncbi:N-6 DNA methylase [Thalassoporum mexicanum PCC 7367]|uniref:N-6 DNA methylase n=1 Tax=Thalassoporum mexicanum TaxID=3457544 RepID=UPI00029FE7BF|nr:N-6 DNA methylase [Pseudanabaena sp. PCC 7367]AFY69590.1 N-6 DNA methylase [Pseudanabaena sp. PCC 7367]
MGRHSKTVATDCGKDRRSIGYYATPPFVAKFLTRKLLEIRSDGENVIDPCVGKGELVADFASAGKRVTGIDLVDFATPINYQFFQFLNHNFIDLYQAARSPDSLPQTAIDFTQFDYWIANPPYNCHEVNYIQSNKTELKRLFHDVGVHNMYSMFLSAIIDLAAEGAAIGLITLDSFLTAKAHTKLRRKILAQTTIHYLLLCPTDLFKPQGADVRTCIMILQKGKQFGDLGNQIKICNRPSSTSEFQCILQKEEFTLTQEQDIVLGDLASDRNRDNHEFLLEVPAEIKHLFKELPRLGQRFNCVTGISTGNDRKYLADRPQPGFSVPFYKNPGTRKFYTRPDAYICDRFLALAKQIKNFSVRNPHLLYQPGITCSSMGVPFSACYLPPGSAYGVNANIICDRQDIWWLIAYLNSGLVSYLVRGILIRTNMITSGYVARIPIPDFDSATKSRLAKISQATYQEVKQEQGRNISPATVLITKICFDYLNISAKTRELIGEFNADLIKRT